MNRIQQHPVEEDAKVDYRRVIRYLESRRLDPRQGLGGKKHEQRSILPAFPPKLSLRSAEETLETPCALRALN